MAENKSFAQTAMELAGKSKQESETVGQIDVADDATENLFEERHKTVNSPIHKAVWGEIDLSQFDAHIPLRLRSDSDLKDLTNSKCTDILKKYYNDEKILGNDGKHNPELLKELAKAGYFGTLVELPDKPKISFRKFIQSLSYNASINAQIAGLSSVHGCIGAVDPVMSFGTKEQKEKFLPKLAAGTPSGFALTEPNAGSDLTALRTTAVLHRMNSREEDYYSVTGEKLFITNARHGGIIGLVCKDYATKKPIVLIVELPEEDNENFQIEKYGIHALKELQNVKLKFNNFKVPSGNLIQEEGLTVAYHGLNYGRTAVCANANGVMKRMLASMVPWGKYRKTYGEKIEKRELVQRRMAQMAGYIVGSEALMNWSAKLLDEGYRGEMECIVGKIAGSEWQKTAAIDLCMKTHGGRSFLHGHFIGDNIHEFLAPCIYEGEGEMLSMAFFKSLVKNHGKTYYEKIGKAVGKPTISNIFKALVKNPKIFLSYGGWKVKNKFKKSKVSVNWDKFDDLLIPHIKYAIKGLKKMSNEIDDAMRKHQLKLADRQCRMHYLSQKTQDLVIILVTCMYANRHVYGKIKAAHVLSMELRNKIERKEISDNHYRFLTEFGSEISTNELGRSHRDVLTNLVSGLNLEENKLDEILMPYSNNDSD